MIVYENSYGEIGLSLFGGQVLSWKTREQSGQLQEQLYQGSEPKRSGIPLLFPFANPLIDNIFTYTGKVIPQHGFARQSTWQQLPSERGARARLTYATLDSQWQAAYPFPFELELEVMPLAETLQYDLVVSNLGNTDLPLSPGIHPYFPVKHDQKHVVRTNIPDLDFAQLNWDSFAQEIITEMPQQFEAFMPDGKRIQITQLSEQTNFKNMVVWSQPMGSTDIDFVCFERFYGQTNTINEDPLLIHPGEIWKKSFTIQISKLEH